MVRQRLDSEQHGVYGLANFGKMEIPAESAQAVMLFLREEGYTEEILSRLGLSKLPWNYQARRLASAWVVTGNVRRDLFIRLFNLGESMTASQSEHRNKRLRWTE
jgi:hypothetical protein